MDVIVGIKFLQRGITHLGTPPLSNLRRVLSGCSRDFSPNNQLIRMAKLLHRFLIKVCGRVISGMQVTLNTKKIQPREEVYTHKCIHHLLLAIWHYLLLCFILDSFLLHDTYAGVQHFCSLETITRVS